MDDIRAPGSAPKHRPPTSAPKQPIHEDNDAQEPERPMHEEPLMQQEEPKSGMKTWLVVLLVVLALVIGAGGVYLWQSSSSNSDETKAMQSQIDTLNQDLTDAKKAAADNTLEEKDKTIETLTAENKALIDSNEALKTRNTELTTNCATADPPLDADCLPVTP